MSELADQDLLSKYANCGDERAFKCLMDRHREMVFATAVRSLGDRALAEEVTQNVFSALAAKAVRLREVKSPAGWLYKSARLEVAMMVRGERRRRRREAIGAERLDEVRKGCDEGVGATLDEAMDGLAAEEQRLVVMRFYEGLSVGELAQRLEITEAAAQKRVERAVGRLRKRVALAGWTLSGGSVSAADFLAVSAGMRVVPVVGAGAGLGGAGIAAVFVGALIAGAALFLNKGRQEAAPAIRETAKIGEVSSVTQMLAVDDIEGIYALEDEAREPALGRLVEYIAKVDDKSYLRQLFLRWSRLDAKRSAIVAVALAEERENLFIEIAGDAVGRWAEADPEQASAFVLQRDAGRFYENELLNTLGEGVVRALANIDAERAFGFVQSLRVTTGAMFRAIWDTVAARNYSIDETLAWLDSLEALESKEVVFEIEHPEGEVHFSHVLHEAGERVIDNEKGIISYPLEMGARKWALGTQLLRKHFPEDHDAIARLLVARGLRQAKWPAMKAMLERDPVAGIEWYVESREAMDPGVRNNIMKWLCEDHGHSDMSLAAAFWVAEGEGRSAQTFIKELRKSGLEESFMEELAKLGNNQGSSLKQEL